MATRPLGLTLLAIGAAVIGVLALVAAAGWWAASDGLALLPRLHGVERVVALTLLATGCLELALAYGVWTLQTWAWPLGVALEIVALVLAILQLGRGIPLSHVTTIVVALVTLWYLATNRVRTLFGRA